MAQTNPPIVESGLKKQLDAYRIRFLLTAPRAKVDAYQRGIDALAASGLLGEALTIGEQAIDFELTNHVGRAVQLFQCLQRGPVVLTWYRGGWCPYCNLALQALQQHLPAFQAEGALLLALTPELPDKSLRMQEKHELAFDVLTDRNNEVARQYGLVFKLPPDVSTFYKQSFNLVKYNGTESDELPLAATYVIDTGGTIRYAFLDADYRRRAEPAALVEALRARPPKTEAGD